MQIKKDNPCYMDESNRNKLCYYGIFQNEISHLMIDFKRLSTFIPELKDKALVIECILKNEYYECDKILKEDYVINSFNRDLDDESISYQETFNLLYKNLKNRRLSTEDKRKYEKLISDLKCKHLINVNRIFNHNMSKILYSFTDSIDDYSYDSFISVIGYYFTTQNCLDESTPYPKVINMIESLPHFKYYKFFKLLINFIKNSTLKAFDNLTNYCEDHEEFNKYITDDIYLFNLGFDGIRYVNTKSKILKDITRKLKLFAKELCELIFNDLDESTWNYSEWYMHQIANYNKNHKGIPNQDNLVKDHSDIFDIRWLK